MNVKQSKEHGLSRKVLVETPNLSFSIYWRLGKNIEIPMLQLFHHRMMAIYRVEDYVIKILIYILGDC